MCLLDQPQPAEWVPRGQDPSSVPHQDHFGKKVMICVWWNFESIVHFELVPNSRDVNAKLYCQQLDRAYEKLKEKYPTLVRRKRASFQQDNAKPHTTTKTKEKFDELEKVEILPHSVYDSDAAPFDYCLLRSMEHFLRGRRFEPFDQVEEACQTLFDSKPAEWYFNEIRMLAVRWQRT